MRRTILITVAGFTMMAVVALGAVKITPVKPAAPQGKASPPPAKQTETHAATPPVRSNEPAPAPAGAKHQTTKQKHALQRAIHVSHKGHLNGSVVGGAKKGPVAGARVSFVRHGHVVGHARTNKAGGFSTKRAAGSYQVRAFKPGSGKGSAHVTIAGGQTSTVIVHLHSKHPLPKA